MCVFYMVTVRVELFYCYYGLRTVVFCRLSLVIVTQIFLVVFRIYTAVEYLASLRRRPQLLCVGLVFLTSDTVTHLLPNTYAERSTKEITRRLHFTN